MQGALGMRHDHRRSRIDAELTPPERQHGGDVIPERLRRNRPAHSIVDAGLEEPCVPSVLVLCNGKLQIAHRTAHAAKIEPKHGKFCGYKAVLQILEHEIPIRAADTQQYLAFEESGAWDKHGQRYFVPHV